MSSVLIKLTQKSYDINADCLLKLLDSNIPILLYGNGIYSQTVLKLLQKHNIDITGYAVDKEYYNPKQHANLYCISLIDSIWDAYYIIHSIDIRFNKPPLDLKNAKEIFYFKLNWNDSDNIDDTYIKSNYDSFLQSYEWLNDTKSKEIYYAYLNSKVNNDVKCMVDLCTFPQYFSTSYFSALDVKNGTFIDCGAFDGDTLRSYTDFCTGRFAGAICFEPDKENFLKLETYAQTLIDGNKNLKDGIILINKAADAKKGVAYFNAAGDTTSSIAAKGIQIETDTIDAYTMQRKITLIKIDIEGSELSALYGAKQTILRDKPILAVCVYHKKDDLITIPQYIKSLNADYKLYLSLHSCIGHELVLYAIP